MMRVIFSSLLVGLLSPSAYAACQWDYLNQLNKDIKHAQDLLGDYSTCRHQCKGLETALNKSLSKMSQTSACGTHILTATNVETINFIGGRFKLIQKQKTASTWASGGFKKPLVEPVVSRVKVPPQPVVLAKPTFVKPPVLKAPQPQSIKAPLPQQVAKQTRMLIPKDAYIELWDDSSATSESRIVQHRENQQKIIRLKSVRQQQAKLRAQQHLKAQQLDRHLKQVLVQQEKVRLVKAKRRAMQDRLHKQRLIRQQFLKKRALAIRVNQQKIRQQRLARIQQARRR